MFKEKSLYATIFTCFFFKYSTVVYTDMFQTPLKIKLKLKSHTFVVS